MVRVFGLATPARSQHQIVLGEPAEGSLTAFAETDYFSLRAVEGRDTDMPP